MGLVGQAEGSPLPQPICPPQVQGGRSREGTGSLDGAHCLLSSTFVPRNTRAVSLSGLS